MRAVEIQESSPADLSPDKILAQVELMTQDDVFRSSKRSIAFLKYVVTEALNGAADQAKDVIAPKVEHRADPKYDEFAVRDKVQGTLQLRLVVDASGVPQRITVARPLGYGLEASAVEAMRKWRFAPGMKDGNPVATGMAVEQQFSLVGGPR